MTSEITLSDSRRRYRATGREKAIEASEHCSIEQDAAKRGPSKRTATVLLRWRKAVHSYLSLKQNSIQQTINVHYRSPYLSFAPILRSSYFNPSPSVQIQTHSQHAVFHQKVLALFLALLTVRPPPESLQIRLRKRKLLPLLPAQWTACAGAISVAQRRSDDLAVLPLLSQSGRCIHWMCAF